MAFIVATLLLNHISNYIIHLFSTISLLFLTIFLLINLPKYCYTISNLSPPFYLFISPLLFTLILLFLYPFIFLYFFLFLFSPFYYKFSVLLHSMHSFPNSHTKRFSLFSLSKFFFFIFCFFFCFYIFFILHLYFRLINFCIP